MKSNTNYLHVYQFDSKNDCKYDWHWTKSYVTFGTVTSTVDQDYIFIKMRFTLKAHSEQKNSITDQY